MILYCLLSFILSVIAAFFAFFFGRAVRQNISLCEKVPRWRIPGMVFGLICLIWSAWYGCIMLEGGLARFHVLVWMLVPIAFIAAFFWLDYLFARSLGGFIVLTVNYLLHAAFVHETFFRSGYSLICLVWGIFGLFLIGMPWCWREWMHRAVENKKIQGGLVVFAVISCICLLIQPLL